MDNTVLWLVICVVVVSKIVDYVGKDNIGEIIWAVYLKLSPSSTIQELRKTQGDAIRVYTQKSNTSSKDEFAKWAKLDREYSRLKQEVDKLTKSLNATKMSVKSAVKVALYGVTGGAKLYMRYKYRKVPVIWLPPGIFPRYILWFLSLTSAPMGSISVSIWLMVANSAVSKMIDIAIGLYKIATASPSPTAAGRRNPVKAQKAQ
uniref:Golgi to ER traffic protein 1 n=1 Tax=Blastobotrys adeninivorans TaxID=409370 RepID=A0A060TDH4_BLAAD